MIEAEVSLGEYKVVCAGSVIGLKDIPTVIKVKALEYHFIFKEDSTNKVPSISSTTDNLLRKIELVNFENKTGIGITKPWHIGHIDGLKLYLIFIVYSIDPTAGKLLHYTFLTGEKK
jgi:hypothetical protein